MNQIIEIAENKIIKRKGKESRKTRRRDIIPGSIEHEHLQMFATTCSQSRKIKLLKQELHSTKCDVDFFEGLSEHNARVAEGLEFRVEFLEEKMVYTEAVYTQHVSYCSSHHV